MKRRTALEGAVLRGTEDQLAGVTRDACPYEDKRKHSGRLTWSRAFRTAWHHGWDAAARDRDQALITVMYARRRF